MKLYWFPYSSTLILLSVLFCQKLLVSLGNDTGNNLDSNVTSNSEENRNTNSELTNSSKRLLSHSLSTRSEWLHMSPVSMNSTIKTIPSVVTQVDGQSIHKKRVLVSCRSQFSSFIMISIFCCSNNLPFPNH